MTNRYACPDCGGELENMLPDGRNQLYINSNRRSSSDEFGRSGGEPALVCWNCNTVYRRADCRVWKGGDDD